MIIKNEVSTNINNKLQRPYDGPMVVKKVLPNDRYLVQDMESSHRTSRKANYENVIAVDRMKPWVPSGGLSDETGSESGEGEVPMDSSGQGEQ